MEGVTPAAPTGPVRSITIGGRSAEVPVRRATDWYGALASVLLMGPTPLGIPQATATHEQFRSRRTTAASPEGSRPRGGGHREYGLTLQSRAPAFSRFVPLVQSPHVTHEREATLVGQVKEPERRVTESDIGYIPRERRSPALQSGGANNATGYLGSSSRPCHKRAIHSGLDRSRADNHGQHQTSLDLRRSHPRR